MPEMSGRVLPCAAGNTDYQTQVHRDSPGPADGRGGTLGGGKKKKKTLLKVFSSMARTMAPLCRLSRYRHHRCQNLYGPSANPLGEVSMY